MRLRYAHVHDDRTLSHFRNDGADAMLGQLLGEGDLACLRIFGFDEVDAEAREIARRGATLDLEGCHAKLEQPSRQLLLNDGAGADLHLFDDEIVRADA